MSCDAVVVIGPPREQLEASGALGAFGELGCYAQRTADPHAAGSESVRKLVFRLNRHVAA